ncbi:hypothetical protein [Acidovorax temperans]|uniref:hypothetical protein n=1 Tax=Acidovorax temperans TaxID=80878 RepID=UPI0035AF0032
MIQDDDELRSFLLDDAPISHPSEAQLNDWIARIRSDERGPAIDGIARVIIRDFYLRNFLGIEQSRVATGWLAESLSEILDHKDPLHALGLLPRPNKRPADPRKGMDVAMWVACAERIGLSHPEAKRQAAEAFHMDESNVGKLIRQYGGLKWMNPDTDVLIEYFKLQGRPLPSASGNK